MLMKLARVGAGARGMIYSRYAHDVLGDEIVAVADRHPEKLKKARSLFGTPENLLFTDPLEMIGKVPEADALIVATPVYFGRATGLYHMYEDRTFKLYTEQPDPPRRKALVIASSKAPRKVAQPTAERLQRILTRRNFETSIFLHSVNEDGAPQDNPDMLARVREAGKSLLD